MIRKVKKDNQKSKSLIKSAKITLERLNKTNIQNYPSNSLIDYYDILHKIMESISCKSGIKIIGECAHKELIEWVYKKYNLSFSEKFLLCELRRYRNRISYEGFNIKKEYIKRNKNKIRNLIKKLLSIYGL
jgi:hypothetical protein